MIVCLTSPDIFREIASFLETNAMTDRAIRAITFLFQSHYI